jgi:hypothetical protein
VASHLRDRILQLAGRGDFDENRLDAKRPGRLLKLLPHGAKVRIVRILQHADALQTRQQLAQQAETLCVNLQFKNGKAGDIAAKRLAL